MRENSKNIKREDIIAFIDPSLKPLKPEIVKAEYIIESIEKILYRGDFASILLRILTQQGISPVINYQTSHEGKKEDKNQNWFKNGLICEVLQMGTSIWQKGRFRIKFNLEYEFIPDNTAMDLNEDNISNSQDANSPLDDIRNKI